MPLTTYTLESDGPVVTVVIGVSAPRVHALSDAGLPVPPVVQVRGLIDTGASHTVVDTSVIESLQLEPTGTIGIRTPSTGAELHQCSQYDVGIGIPMHHGLQMMQFVIPVVESHLAPAGIQALIGRDVLDRCLFLYNGAEGYFLVGV